MKNGGRKDKQKYGIRKILKEVIENEFKITEVILKDEIDYSKYENILQF